jgi:FkbM family methyltransferase
MVGYASQFGQDRFLDRLVFGRFGNGVFVDVGAHDGATFSNTVFFERERGWKGLCIEPNPAVFARLRQARRAECLQCCIATVAGETEFLQIQGDSEMLSGMVAAYSPEHRERISSESRKDGSSERVIPVSTRPLSAILSERGMTEVHFLSVDTEGGENEVLQSIDFDGVLIHAIAIENNYDDARILDRLTRQGFVPLIRLSVDTIYVNRRSPFLSAVLRSRCHGLRAAARIERKLRKLRVLAPGPAAFPYKKPR